MQPPHPVDAPLIEHLAELRRRLLGILAAALAGFLAAWAASDHLIHLALHPLRQAAPHLHLVTLSVTEGFVTTVKLAAWAGLTLAFPVVVWQVWAFVSPALTPSERPWAILLLLPALCCFLIGGLFCWGVVLPPALSFLIAANGTDFQPAFSYGAYIEFVITFMIVTGILFELPLLLAFLDAIGILPVETLRSHRRHAIVAAFVVGAVFSPPDVVSQLLVSVPIVFLTEAGIWLSVA
ncbi:MAG TPA: twin-arginine translocase subunit TatC, partial [Candidatus Ozemobacteraceae bacterium]|nr:twin-arginine translocase subunit TatC [Candidatus Ozemobacteraceae bacterium]